MPRRKPAKPAPSSPLPAAVHRARGRLEGARRQWLADPAGRGALKVLIGVVLIVSGLLSALGEVPGLLLSLGVGLLLLFLGLHLEPQRYADERRIEGEVVGATDVGDGIGGLRYRPIYRFKAGRKVYRFDAALRTLRPPQLGAPVQIAYSAEVPDCARRLDGLEGRLHLLAYAAGGGVMLLSLFNLVVSVVMVVAGGVAVRSGSADRADCGVESGGLFADSWRLVRGWLAL